jgi:hypothetical protein
LSAFASQKNGLSKRKEGKSKREVNPPDGEVRLDPACTQAIELARRLESRLNTTARK